MEIYLYKKLLNNKITKKEKKIDNIENKAN